jgi:hypothetical protein
MSLIRIVFSAAVLVTVISVVVGIALAGAQAAS